MQAPGWFEAALAEQPTLGAVQATDLVLAVRSWGRGSGTPVVLVHGGAAHSGWWDHVAPLLAAERRVVAVDLAGHGDSGRRPDYSIDSWAEDLESVVERIGRPAVVVGHSLGGMVALRLAQRIGDRLAGVVLLDSIVGVPAIDQSTGAPGMAAASRRRYPSEEQAVERFRLVPAQECPPWVLQHIAAGSVARLDGGWGWKFDGRVFDGRLFLATPDTPVACRAAYLRAEHGLVADAEAELLGAAVGASVATVPDAGHHLLLDQPLALVAALRVLLSGWAHDDLHLHPARQEAIAP